MSRVLLSEKHTDIKIDRFAFEAGFWHFPVCDFKSFPLPESQLPHLQNESSDTCLPRGNVSDD